MSKKLKKKSVKDLQDFIQVMKSLDSKDQYILIDLINALKERHFEIAYEYILESNGVDVYSVPIIEEDGKLVCHL